MRILLIAFLMAAFGACTNPVQENYRQLDINLDRSITHKKDQVKNLARGKDKEVLDSVEFAFDEVKKAVDDVNEAIFNNPDPDIFLLEERNSLTELVTLPNDQRERFRQSIINYSERLNDLSRQQVCTLSSDSTYYESRFETYFTEQQKPALLVFIKKIELDCWQCRFMATFEEVE
ncbi:hypothetical protein [Halocola ammonii]